MYSDTFKKIGLHIFCLSLLFFPLLVSAQVPQGNIFGITYQCSPKQSASGVTVYGECNFQDLVLATQLLVNWATGFALAFSVIVIAWAGFKYMISGDNPGERKAANKMLTKVLIGIGFIIGAWLIVKLIVSGLGVNTGPINFTP